MGGTQHGDPKIFGARAPAGGRRSGQDDGCEVASTFDLWCVRYFAAIVLTGPRVARREQPTLSLGDL